MSKVGQSHLLHSVIMFDEIWDPFKSNLDHK